MNQDTITNESLPIVAFPNLLRGMSQFKKTGIISFSTGNFLGELLVHEGVLQGLQFRNSSFVDLFLGRLEMAGVIPSQVSEMLASENLGIDAVCEILSVHDFDSMEHLQNFKKVCVDDVMFCLLDEPDGSIQFELRNSFDEMRHDTPDYLAFEEVGEVPGRYPCQLLLDYVESKILLSEFCSEGDYLSLQVKDFTKTLLMNDVEKKVLSFAEIESDLDSVLKGVLESRLYVGKLLAELRETGVINCIPERTSNITEQNNASLIKSAPASGASEGTLPKRENLMSRMNTYLMSPRGVELVLGALLPPFAVCALLYVNRYLTVFFEEVRSMMPN